MKSLIDLVTALLADAGSICSVETARDLETIKSRAQHEGISFFTITLPDFASDFERSLELGQVDPTLFLSWRKKARLPLFLRGFVELVFGTNGGIRDEPSTNAVFCIRQVCRVFKKVRLPCSIQRESRAFRNYVKTEATLSEHPNPESSRHEHFCAVAKLLWSEVFGSECNTFGLVPKHGPGATCEGISGNAKYSHMVWYDRLDRSFPVTEHYFTSVNHMLCDEHGLNNMTIIPETQELPVRVISVPKTLKAPRIIAIEPVCMQYTQQALSRWIVENIQRSVLTKTVIRFNDQTFNQRAAMRGSLDGSISTIDLSDASDRVPLSMVCDMLKSCPELLAAALACRSTTAKLPDGTIVPLVKFASMGSALCFPIESMYFYTIIVHAILWAQSLPPSRSQMLDLAKRVHVFGDDITVPSDQTDIVLEALAYYYCKVNATKSFWRGKFRESCGVDAFCGVDVTPTYIRETRPSDKRASAGIVSWIATSNLFHEAGLWQTAHYMKNVVESLLGSLPVVHATSPGLGWYSFLGPKPTGRMCKYLHKPLVRTFIVRPKKVKDPLNGYPALLKYFLQRRNQEIDAVLRPLSADKEHLLTSARCGTVSRKRQWVPSA